MHGHSKCPILDNGYFWLNRKDHTVREECMVSCVGNVSFIKLRGHTGVLMTWNHNKILKLIKVLKRKRVSRGRMWLMISKKGEKWKVTTGFSR
jgi:hypothetical protein